MFIINLIKKLMGQAQEKVAHTPSGLTNAIDKASSSLDKLTEPSKAEPQHKEEAPAEQSGIQWQDRVTIGEKTYKVDKDYINFHKLYESTDGGKHWTFVNTLPLVNVYGLAIAAHRQLAIGGRLLANTETLWKDFKSGMAATGALIAGGEKAYDAVTELQDMKIGGCYATVRAYRLDEEGQLLIDSAKDSLSIFRNIPHQDTTMVVGAPSYCDELKKALKAAGLKGAEKVEIKLRNYLGQKEVLFSLDGQQWLQLEGDMPKVTMSFEHYKNITVANDEDGKHYLYFGNEWRAIDFEADLEFEDTDAPKAYKRLDVKEVVYYDNSKFEVGKTKVVHLLISNGKKGFWGESPKVFYIANDHVLQDEFDYTLSGDEIVRVENIAGEVIVTSLDKKKTYHEIFRGECWRSCGGYKSFSHTKDNDDDDIDQARFAGPYGFESVILDDDPLWEKVNSPIEEYPLDVKGKEVAKTKKIIIKVIRKYGSGSAFFYLDNYGYWTFMTLAAGGNDYTSLYSTGRPQPRYDKKGNITCYDPSRIIYFADNSGKYFCWMRKKKGLFKKEIVYEWQEVNPVDMEMMGKVYPKG